jgi:hypothetical protein
VGVLSLHNRTHHGGGVCQGQDLSVTFIQY